MIYSHEVETMCPVRQGVAHGAAPIPEQNQQHNGYPAGSVSFCFYPSFAFSLRLSSLHSFLLQTPSVSISDAVPSLFRTHTCYNL